LLKSIELNQYGPEIQTESLTKLVRTMNYIYIYIYIYIYNYFIILLLFKFNTSIKTTYNYNSIIAQTIIPPLNIMINS